MNLERRLRKLLKELLEAKAEEFEPKPKESRGEAQDLPPPRFYGPPAGKKPCLPGIDDPVRLFLRDGRVFLVTAYAIQPNSAGKPVCGYRLRSAPLVKPAIAPGRSCMTPSPQAMTGPSEARPFTPAHAVDSRARPLSPVVDADLAQAVSSPGASGRTRLALLASVPLLLLLGGWMIFAGVFEASIAGTQSAARDPLADEQRDWARELMEHKRELVDLRSLIAAAEQSIKQLEAQRAAMAAETTWVVSAAVRPLATKVEIANLASRDELAGLASGEELKGLASQAELDLLKEAVGKRPADTGSSITLWGAVSKNAAQIDKVRTANNNWSESHDYYPVDYRDGTRTFRIEVIAKKGAR